MRKKYTGIILIFILSMCVSFVVDAQDNRDELMNLYAQSAVLMDADSGRILFGKNENETRAMASTTKIMTCILVLENMKEDSTVIVSERASNQPKVRLGLQKKEEYYMKDLLFSLMLESHNDSAVALAEGIAGSVEKFTDLMNQKAKELDCVNTHFVTPNGLDEADENGIHSTTAADLAKIMKYCIQDSSSAQQFLEVTQTESYEFKNVKGTRSFACYNHNALLQTMDGVISGKTGFTNRAGYCYVGALKRDERIFIVVLLGCGWPNNRNYKWKDAKRLLEYGMKNYNYKDINIRSISRKIEVEDGAWTDFVQAGMKNEVISFEVLKRKDEKVQMNEMIISKLVAPVRKGEKVGKIIFSVNNEVVHIEEICTKHSVGKKTMQWCLKKIFCLWALTV